VKKKKQRWVVKLGSGILTNSRGGIDTTQIRHLADQIPELHSRGIQVILVSSGAVSAGMTMLGLDQRPRDRVGLQACATIGQPLLMKAYNQALARRDLHAAQILITYWDLDSRQMYKNTQATLRYLLSLGNAVPIVNENDALSFDEIEMLNRFGDNDRLSAQVALLAEAHRLVILSSIDGLFTKPDGTGDLVREVTEVDERIESFAGSTRSQRSVGGMISKLETAKLMLSHNLPMTLANGRHKRVLVELADGAEIGTRFEKKTRRKGKKKS
jgi:glutamate 5-kinase